MVVRVDLVPDSKVAEEQIRRVADVLAGVSNKLGCKSQSAAGFPGIPKHEIVELTGSCATRPARGAQLLGFMRADCIAKMDLHPSSMQ
jgi:hypothetical protein